MSDTPRYRVLHSLGKGGMGEVFLADDTQLGRQVAIKFLADGATNDDKALDRLYREARSAAALDHPYICKIFEITDVDGRTGIVMEHVTGETLQAELARTPVSPKRAIEIAGEIAEALEEAHKKRVIHRDLKPANVMLTEQGHVKVMDFGLAKQVRADSGSDDQTTESLTDPGTRVGTPGYMAPEQLLGSDADERSDIFAFGILLYELLAGVHPFRRSSHSGTMAAILREPHAPVGQYAKDTSETARVTLDRLLAKEPSDRYQSFLDVRTDLHQLQPGSGAVLATSAAAPSLSGRTPFVGRESERAEARRYLDQAIKGQGGVLLLGGEPGVGKTRLAEELLLEARQRGCLVLTGRCYEMEGTPPFIPWVEMVERSAAIVPKAAFREVLGDAAPEMAKLVPELRRTFPDIPAPIELPPEQQRRYLFNSFLDFVKRGVQVTPQVVLIDDLHWADESSLLLLQHVAQHASEIPLLIVGTYRDVDLEVARPFAKMLEAFTRQRLAHKIALRRLPEAGVGDMLRALSGQTPPNDLVAAIFTGTEGNPFFVEEVFQHLLEEGRLFDEESQWRADLRVEDLGVPEGIRLVIGRRVERLSSEARHVLTTAAIVGRSFDLLLLEALGDAEGEALLTALEEAEGAKLIQAASSDREVRWEFAHGLIRQTLESGLSLPRRQNAHLRVAEALERVYADHVDRHASDLGHHLFQAGRASDPKKTVRFLTLAGDQALAAGAFAEALRQFENALSIRDEGDEQHVADLLYKRGRALRSLGRTSEAVEQWRASLDVYERIGDRKGIAQTAFDAAWVLAWLNQFQQAQALARRGLAALQDDDMEARCRLLVVLATFCGGAGDDYEVACDPLQEAEQIAETLGQSALTAELLQAQTTLHYIYMHPHQAVDVGKRAARLLRERGELYVACDVYFSTVMSAVLSGRLSEASVIGNELRTLSARVGHVNAHWCAGVSLAYYHLMTTDNIAASTEVVRRVVEYAESRDIAPRAFSDMTLGLAHFFGGDWAAAESALADAVRFAPERSWGEAMFPSSELLVDAYAGRDVLDRLLTAKSRVLQIGDENPWGVWDQLVNVVESLAVLGQQEDAADLYPLVAKGIRKGVVINWQLRLWEMVAGIAAACGKHWDAAQQHYETALTQAHDLPHRIAQPEVRRWYAQTLLDRDNPGDRDKARELLGEATEMYHAIGMPKHLEMVEKVSAAV